MNAYQTDLLLAVIAPLTVIGFLFHLAIGALRRVLIPWTPVRQGVSAAIGAGTDRERPERPRTNQPSCPSPLFPACPPA